MPNTNTPMRYTRTVKSTVPIRSRPTPARTICGTVTWPLVNTIAFGPVADGNMKLHTDAANVDGTISNNGSRCNAWAVAASTGIMRVVVAVLLANSVTQAVSRVTRKMTSTGDNWPSDD